MRGYQVDMSRPTGDVEGALPPWQGLAIDAVGTVIEFWGFKRNQGRVWALLYLTDSAMRASDLQEALGLSKGATSIVTRELERWHIIHRVRLPGERAWYFVADSDFMRMIGRVVTEREFVVIGRVREQLEAALSLAQQEPALSPQMVERVQRLVRLATLMERAVSAFLQTARLDVRAVAEALDGTVRATVRGAVDSAIDAIRKRGTRT